MDAMTACGLIIETIIRLRWTCLSRGRIRKLFDENYGYRN